MPRRRGGDVRWKEEERTQEPLLAAHYLPPRWGRCRTDRQTASGRGVEGPLPAGGGLPLPPQKKKTPAATAIRT